MKTLKGLDWLERFALVLFCAILILIGCSATAQTPTPAPTAELKDASDPKSVIVIAEVNAGTIAEAIQKYPSLKAKLEGAATKIAKEKEKALMKVKDKDPARAKIKMDELIALGIPISKDTRDAVIAAGRPAPTAGTPTPSPSPTPSDGLD